MKKEDLAKLVTDYGDAIITYRSENSKKLKYNVCTIDFSTPYIQTKKNRAKESDRTLLLFCWDTDFICSNWKLWVLAQGIVQQQKGNAKWRGMMIKKRL